MSAERQSLLACYEQLDAGARQSLLAFAEFLVSRTPGTTAVPHSARVVIPEPERIERPAQESIVAGLKRLSKTYFMLDKSEMLGATSDLVATSLLQGADAAAVIDELEAIFADHYRQLQATQRGE
jgi:hypothetical protein